MMDFTKKWKLLAGLNASLLVAIALGLVISPSATGSGSTRHDLLADAATVAAIRIEGKDAVSLAKSGDRWAVRRADGDLPADEQRVASFIKAVDSIERIDLVAKDGSSWETLGLKGDGARRVSLSGAEGNALCDFTLGRYAAAPGSVYAAIAGSDKAYSVAAGMASYVMGSSASWLDLRLWTAMPTAEAVQELSVKGAIEAADGTRVDATYTLTRSDRDWVAGGLQLDAAKVDAMIRAIASMRGDDYAPATEKAEPAILTVEMRLGNGRTLSLVLEAKRADGTYTALSSQREQRLYLPSWALSDAIKPLSALLSSEK